MVQDDVFKHKIHRQVLCSSGDARAKQRTYLFQLLHRKEGCGMHYNVNCKGRENKAIVFGRC